MSEPRSEDPRTAAAVRVLEGSGVMPVSVQAHGHEREIAVVRTNPEHWSRLLAGEGSAIVREVKALGFRYVAVDLDPDER